MIGGSAQPPARWGTVAGVYLDSMIIYGGVDTNQVLLFDLWMFNFSKFNSF